MNTFNSMKCAAVLLPALAMGIPMANASDEDCDCPCESDRTTAMNSTDRNTTYTEIDRNNTYNDTDRMGNNTNRDDHRVAAIPPTTSDDDSEWSSDDSEWSTETGTANNDFIETMPTRGYHSDSLVGQEVTNRSNDETVGEISNLVLDENGQVVAVILSVGGVMGIGEREVAIAFDRIERTEDGDDTKLFVNLTEDELEDAPKYSSDRNVTRR